MMTDIQMDRKAYPPNMSTSNPPEKPQHMVGVDEGTAAYATGPPVEIDKAGAIVIRNFKIRWG